jgi:hypothetical protein
MTRPPPSRDEVGEYPEPVDTALRSAGRSRRTTGRIRTDVIEHHDIELVEVLLSYSTTDPKSRALEDT